MQDKLTEETAYKLIRISGFIWQAMEELIKAKGYSTETLHLEGSVYDLQEIVEKSQVIKDSEPDRKDE